MMIIFLNSARNVCRRTPFRKTWTNPSNRQFIENPPRTSNIIITRNLSNEEKNSDRAQWKGIFTKFVPVGICLIAVMQWRFYRRTSSERIAKQWEINFYCMLPLRTISRCWGWLADVHLPEWLRPFVYGLYSNTFGVNLSEALHEDLRYYPSLADFFARPLKSGIRQINDACDLVSPCDGTVLHFGTVQTGEIEQVKGVTYSIENFLGVNNWSNNNCDSNDYRLSLLHKRQEGNILYQCVIYLAPGDYHRFHSPTEWRPTHRRHFHGQLLSVSPKVAKWLPGLFSLNERVTYLGMWKHGFFSYTAVGATNVGKVKVYCDNTLYTNHPKKSGQCKDLCLGGNVSFNRGDPFGEFRMGSTIVLIFEAPQDFRFDVRGGDRVRLGQCIGKVAEQQDADRSRKSLKNS